MIKNPFNISYLTEAGLKSEELLSNYSFFPFKYINKKISQSINVILLGRMGIGKTMLLKLFEPDLMQLLYSKDDLRETLPRSVVGIYVNMATARLGKFKGKARPDAWWLNAYSDYLNCVFMEKAIDSLKKMAKVPKWIEDGGQDIGENNNWIADFLDALKEETPELGEVNTLEEYLEFNFARKSSWIQFLNSVENDSPSIPTHFLELGVPLFKLTKALRNFIPEFRLFVLIDQYESLYAARSNIDYRPIFNHALLASSRGNTGVEFKIGTRHYAHSNLSLPDSSGKVEVNREFVEIDLDQLINAWYPKFIYDLFRKRLQIPITKIMPDSANKLVLGFSSAQEADKYQGRGDHEKLRHLTPFFNRWVSLGVDLNILDSLKKNSKVLQAKPLHATISAIGVTRWIRDRYRGCPFISNEAKQSKNIKEKIHVAFLDLIDDVEAKLDNRKKDMSPQKKAVDNLCHDTKGGALFLLAAHFKNNRKFFCGLDTLIRVSSNVTLTFLEIMRAAYDFHILEGKDPYTDPLSQMSQREAVYRVSERWFERIPQEFDCGETMLCFIKSLGKSFRRLQIELSLPEPSPNSISVSKSIFLPGQELFFSQLIIELINWGLLEESSHEHKQKARYSRKKLSFNKILCPYLGIDIISKKDPICIENIDEFVKEILDEKEPLIFQEKRARSKKGTKTRRSLYIQKELF